VDRGYLAFTISELEDERSQFQGRDAPSNLTPENFEGCSLDRRLRGRQKYWSCRKSNSDCRVIPARSLVTISTALFRLA